MENENNELTCLTSFFQAFAERAYKENDLSDVTYALCRSDAGFMKFFLKFFFGAKLQPNDVKAFEREHSEDMGRPDFWIETKTGEVYIVEVKIGDGHQHFHDYHKLLKKHLHLRREDQAWDHLGYIANYKVTTTEKGKSIDKDCKGCSVHTWQQFKTAIEEREDLQNNQLVAAYVQYLKFICHFYDVKIPEGWKICGKDFKCFRELVGEFDDAIKKTKGEWKDSKGMVTGEWKCKVYNSRRPSFFSQYCFGEFFELVNFDKKGNSVWGWLGAYYVAEGINICVEFENRQGRGGGKPVCDKFGRDKMEDGVLRFWIGKNADDAIKIDDFFQRVIDMVVGNVSLADRSDADIVYTKNNAKCFKREALAMQLLPYVLETQLLTSEFRKMLMGKGYMMELSEDEDQWCYCGRSFTFKHINSNRKNNQHLKRQEIYGWLGVFFMEGSKKVGQNAKGEDLKKHPKFVVELDKDFLDRKKKLKKRRKGAIWYEDDYGYGCHDIYIEGDGLDFNEVLEKARKVILDAIRKGNK